MKKFLIFFVLILSSLISGCTSKDDVDPYVKSIDVINLTLPYKFIEDINENKIDEYIKALLSEEDIYDVTDTGSEFIITLTPEKAEEIKEYFFKNISDYTSSVLNGDLSYLIKNISFNATISEYIVYVNSEEVVHELEDLAIELMKKGSLYQALLGKDPENTNVVVNILNSENRLVIERFESLSYYNMFDESHDHDHEH